VESTQERTLNGLIELWADVYSTEIYSIQGKRFTAGQLKPYVKAALVEPDSSIHRIIESDANKADACIKYGRVSARVRHNRIVQNLIRKELRDNELLRFFNDIFYSTAMLYIRFGITFAEAEKRMKQSFERALSHISLRHLLNKPSGNDIPHWFALHPLLSISPLSAGSIAGANVRLRRVLEQRFKTFSGDTCYYEQDLKSALWECWNGRHIDECVKMLRKQGDTTEQMVTLKRIVDGEDPKLLRSMICAMLRRAIEDLDDIRQDIRDWKTQDVELSMPDNIDMTKVSTLLSQDAELSKEDGRQAIIEAFVYKGIGYNDLTPKEWTEIFERYDLIRKGYEYSSKVGLSINSFYGKAAHAKEQKWSRIKNKIRELSK